MRLRGVLVVVVMTLWVTQVSADIVEVKGRGTMNGKIISQNENELNFKAASGENFIFSKKDVLFSEFEKEPTFAEKFQRMTRKLTKNEPPKKLPVPPKIAELQVPTSAGVSTGALSATGSEGLMSTVLAQASQAQVMAKAHNDKMQRQIALMEGGV